MYIEPEEDYDVLIDANTYNQDYDEAYPEEQEEETPESDILFE